MTEPSSTDIRRAAMDLLARREHSCGELQQKLQKRFGKIPELIGKEIARLTAQGLQDDRRMAESFIRSRLRRGQGPIRIRSDLRGKDVAESDVEFVLESMDINWYNRVSEVAIRKYGDTPPVDMRERSRRGRFLQQRGFTFDQISHVL